jgi:hypothetical protein
MSEIDDLKKILLRMRLNRLLVEAESDLHKRLVSSLKGFARGNGFEKELSQFESGLRPDGLFLTGDETLLFVGDAKVAENEPSTNAASLRRVFGYVREFAELVGDHQIEGGMLAVITDERPAAEGWGRSLEYLASEVGLTDRSGKPPHFRIRSVDEFWIAYW